MQILSEPYYKASLIKFLGLRKRSVGSNFVTSSAFNRLPEGCVVTIKAELNVNFWLRTW
jgi:hypothetical protein